jgi:hypothetical protein
LLDSAIYLARGDVFYMILGILWEMIKAASQNKETDPGPSKPYFDFIQKRMSNFFILTKAATCKTFEELVEPNDTKNFIFYTFVYCEIFWYIEKSINLFILHDMSSHIKPLLNVVRLSKKKIIDLSI